MTPWPGSRRARWLAAAVALVALSAPFWAPAILRRMDFFRVRRVEILGAHYVAASDILARLDVDTTASVWDPTAPLGARVATHPEIQRAVVRRKLPGTLVVEIAERVPIALVPGTNGFRAYDARGEALPIDLARTSVDAPILMKVDPPLLGLLAAMREQMPDFYARVSAVRRSGDQELQFDLNRLAVRAMQDVTLARLAEILPVEADLRRKNQRAVEIDLRYRDQVIARLQ